LIALGLAAVLSCGLGTWWVIPSREPRVERLRVTVEQHGADVAEIDRSIAAPLAAALSELEGSEVVIASSEGLARAVVELPADGTALSRVRDRVAAMTLPESAHPVIMQAPRGRAVRWLVRGERAAERQRMLRLQVERVGHHEVRTCAREEEVHVVVDAERAAMLGAGAVAVADALAREAVELPGGHLEQGGSEYLIRGHGALDSLASIGEVVIAIRESVLLRVADVATVTRAPAPDGCACFAGGEPCASGAVLAGEGRVREALSGVEEMWPAGQTLTWVDGALLFSAPAGTSREALHRLGESLAEVAAGVGGVGEVAVELSPPLGEGGPADLALLLVFERGVDPSATLTELRAAVTRVPGLLLHPPEGAAEIVITGDELAPLVEAARSVKGALEGIARVVAFGAERAPEVRVEIDRARAAALGVTTADLAREVRIATTGEVAAHHREGAREYPVRVRTEAALDALRVSTPSGSVPIHELATIEHTLAPPALYRCGAQRCVRLAIDGDPDALERAEERLPSIELPPAVTLRWRAPTR
jgi:multidrug efflux pump subunit AcrB